MNRTRTLVAVAGVLLSLSACTPRQIVAAIQTRGGTPVECSPRCPADEPSQPATPLTPEEIKAFTTPQAPQAPGPEPERFAQPPAPQSVGQEIDPRRP